jgi:hypothetical protein
LLDYHVEEIDEERIRQSYRVFSNTFLWEELQVQTR